MSLVTQVGSRLKVKENQTEVSRVEMDARDRSHERALSPPVWVPNWGMGLEGVIAALSPLHTGN